MSRMDSAREMDSLVSEQWIVDFTLDKPLTGGYNWERATRFTTLVI